MRILITGANGFLGRNMALKAGERADVSVCGFTRRSQPESLPQLLDATDFVFHLAGVNRPQDAREFIAGNVDLTEQLCAAVKATNRRIPIVYASSIQAERDGAYGRSKREAELALERLHAQTGNPVRVFRLPNIFGKWARPNYNSVVATFCHNIARDLPIRIDAAAAPLRLVYVDDVVTAFLGLLGDQFAPGWGLADVEPQYELTVQQLADQIRAFKACRTSLVTERVGAGLVRALYATYVSYLPEQAFAYDVPCYADARGVFVEMLKTLDSGQFSFFTAHPGITRGGHYHHTKTEKFLVMCGKARFRFRSLLDGRRHEIETSGEQPQVVETIPGWTHDITNIGQEELLVMLWANEIFDRASPDTIASAV